MATASPALVSFNGGEASPLLDGRIDYAKYASMARVLDNFKTTVQGPIRKRGGTRFVAEVKDSAKQCWLSTFEYNVTNAYVLEFGDLYVRFFTQHAQLVSGPPVEVVTPYAQANLFNTDGTCKLRTAQSADFLYITHGTYEPRILERLTATSFSLVEFRPTGGPFKDLNDTATTVYASAETGAVTLTASASIFQAGHVDSLFLLEAKDVNSIPAWEVGKVVVAGDRRRVGSRVYEALNGATTGSATPVHTVGAQYDGDTGVQWAFRDAGFGYVRLTGFTSGTVMTGTVEQRLPKDCVLVGNATTRWAHAAWSSVEGWPTDVAFFRERLVMARGSKLWFSVSQAFDDFSARNTNGEVTSDMAITVTLSSGKINSIQWLLPDKFLLAGTAGGEFAIGELTNGAPLGPGNIRGPLQSQFGSNAIIPVQAGAAILFVQRAGRKVREITYDVNSDGYTSNDRTALAEHITKPGLIDLDYAQEPDSIAWGTRSDGRLIGFTWNAEQNVWAWHGHTTDGLVESVACIPSPDQATNELWLIVRRTVNGVEKRYVEFMEPEWDNTTSQATAFYVDCGLSYSGVPVLTISGLGHLEGKTISLLVDGSPHPARTVVGGSVTLQRAGSVVHAGLPFAARLKTMRIEAGAQNGTAQGKVKRATGVTFRFADTVTGQYGADFDALDEFTFRTASDPMDEPVPPFNGDKLVAWPGGYDTDGFLCFYDDKPCPVTIVGVFPQVTTSDAR